MLALSLTAGCATPSAVGGGAMPFVIAHRGASGERPEHTLEAYRVAIEAGADFIEPDLVPTSDGVLVARHENEISGTTDVASRAEFAGRRTTKTIDGAEVTGWFTEDFTFAELRTLRARERLPELRPGNAAYDGRFGIPTLDQIFDLVKAESARRGRQIGIYPETKHPSYFAQLGLALEGPLVAALDARGYRGPDAPVFIQSFEVANLRKLREMTRLPLVQLLAASGQPADFALAGDSRTYADLATPDGLTEIARYADGIGPDKRLIVPRDSAGRSLEPTSLVADAHAAGLVVHPWTFRAENYFLPAESQTGNPAAPEFPRLPGNAAAEYELFFRLGVDGVFSDNPAAAVRARAALEAPGR